MLLVAALPGAARAQLGALIGNTEHQQGSPDQPVTFTADSVEYDRDNALVTAQGHVEAWQEARSRPIAALHGHFHVSPSDGEAAIRA